MKKIYYAFAAGLAAGITLVLLAGCSLDCQVDAYYPGRAEQVNRESFWQRPRPINQTNLEYFESWRANQLSGGVR